MSIFLQVLLATAVIATLITLRLLADRLILRSRQGHKFGPGNCQPAGCVRDCHKSEGKGVRFLYQPSGTGSLKKSAGKGT